MRSPSLLLLISLAVAAAGCQSSQTRDGKTNLPSPYHTVQNHTVQKSTVTAESGIYAAR